jgi:hypothetical protein
MARRKFRRALTEKIQTTFFDVAASTQRAVRKIASNG